MLSEESIAKKDSKYILYLNRSLDGENFYFTASQGKICIDATDEKNRALVSEDMMQELEKNMAIH